VRGRLLLLFVLLGTLVPGLQGASGVDAPVVAIIDSGIDAAHPQFEPGQVVAWKDWVNGLEAPYDDRGHGTAVASRAAGLTFGAYPGAKLAVAKVLSKDDEARVNDVNAAIRWAADQGATTINVSIWGELPDPYAARTTAAAVHYAREKGALVVWIAGNGGEVEVEGDTVPNPVPTVALWGSSSPEALVVGSATTAGKPDQYSQTAPELIARGSGVAIAWPGGYEARGWGTSFAAPFVAGYAARLVAEGAPRDADWLKWVINHTAVDDPGVSYLREGYGFFHDASFTQALAIVRGEAPLPVRDARDADHDRAMLVASVQTGQEPAGTTRP